jgi:hypothetical protein
MIKFMITFASWMGSALWKEGRKEGRKGETPKMWRVPNLGIALLLVLGPLF